MYSIASHGELIRDHGRVSAYREALRRTVRPDSVVLDIGTGSGIFALLACELGAQKVYAVDHADIIRLAREIVAVNGYSSRIEFIQAESTGISLPEPVHVIVSDLRGVLPFFQGHIPAIVDARKRFLASGGTLVPLCDTLWVALVEVKEVYARLVDPWKERACGFDLSPALRLVTNTCCKVRVSSEQLLVEPKCWSVLDYMTVEGPDACGTAGWTAEREGTAYGLISWFDSILTVNVFLTNKPDSPELIYGAVFFPFLKPFRLVPGDGIRIALQAKFAEPDYIWCWNTRVSDRSDNLKTRFSQSTAFSTLLSPERLRKISRLKKPVKSSTLESLQKENRTPCP